MRPGDSVSTSFRDASQATPRTQPLKGRASGHDGARPRGPDSARGAQRHARASWRPAARRRLGARGPLGGGPRGGAGGPATRGSGRPHELGLARLHRKLKKLYGWQYIVTSSAVPCSPSRHTSHPTTSSGASLLSQAKTSRNCPKWTTSTMRRKGESMS